MPSTVFALIAGKTARTIQRSKQDLRWTLPGNVSAMQTRACEQREAMRPREEGGRVKLSLLAIRDGEAVMNKCFICNIKIEENAEICGACGARNADALTGLSCKVDESSSEGSSMNYYDPFFCGTDHYYKHPFGFLYTDSIRHFCIENKAYWILDLVGSYLASMRDDDLFILSFDVKNSACTFYIKRSIDEKIIKTQEIEYTDLGYPIKIFYENNVLCFPSDR